MDLKKIASDAGTFFNRAKQFTEEKLGSAEKTELDAHFENLEQRADKTRLWTEKILHQTEVVLQPNPSVRMQEYVYGKLDRKPRDQHTSTELLGQLMIEAGNSFGPGTAYGSCLTKCGQTEQKLGHAEREFIQSAANNFLQPLKAFLEGDMKTVQKERRILEAKRLDLDACKNKIRKVKSTGGKDQAETELRIAQAEFDRQAEITKLLLEGVSSAHAHHLRCLHDFIEAQQNCYAQCQQYLTDLQRQLGGISVSNPGGSSHGNLSPTLLPRPSNPSAPPAHLVNNNSTSTGALSSGKLAKVLYDYDAADQSELSLIADEVITVYSITGEQNYLMGERGTQQGRVPHSYIKQLID